MTKGLHGVPISMASGLVRVKFQEWPMTIRSRPVVTFGEARDGSLPLVRSSPLIRKERE